MVCSAIPPNEVLGFFSIKSYGIIGSVVPTASPWMVRSEFHNGASKKFLSELIFSVLLTREALYYCFKFLVLVSQVTISNSLLFLLYWCFITLLFMMQFIDHTYWNPISYLIPLPSFYHPSLYPHPFSFPSQPRISFLF